MNHAVANAEPDVAGLIAGYQPGFSLDAQFYTSESIFRKDLDKIL